MSKLKNYSSIFLRIGMGLIIMWFGSQQLLHPDIWTGFLPDFVKSFPITAISFVYLNGWFEVFASLLLIMGLFTRTVALLMALHLLGIVFSLGYDATAMRDLGLVIALISIFLNSKDSLSIDSSLNSEITLSR